MQKGYLSKKQALTAGVVLLNSLNLKVKAKKEDDNTFPIMCGENQVGEISINQNHVSILAKNEDFEISANYKVPYANGLEDYESGLSGVVLATWNSNIDVFFHTKNDVYVAGEISIMCSADRQLGKGSRANAELSCETPNLGKFNLRMYRQGYNFLYTNEKPYKDETITMQLCSEYICHRIKDLSTSEIIDKYYSVSRNRDNSVHKFYRIQKSSVEEDCYSENRPSTSDKDSLEYVCELGACAKEVAPKMFERISQIRNELVINNSKLLDVLANTCMRNEKLIKSLLGFTPEQIKYQNGATNLTDGYFGLSNSLFLPENSEQSLK